MCTLCRVRVFFLSLSVCVCSNWNGMRWQETNIQSAETERNTCKVRKSVTKRDKEGEGKEAMSMRERGKLNLKISSTTAVLMILCRNVEWENY